MKQIYSKILLLMTMALMGVSAWANPGDEITSPDDVVSGKSYYIKGVYAASGVETVCYYGPTDDKSKFKVTTEAVASIDNAMPITFTKVEGGWTLTTPNGFYVRPHTSNGQSYLEPDPVLMQLTAGKTKNGDGIKIGAYNEYYLQMNKTAPKLGAYKNTQYDVTLVEAGSAPAAPVDVTGVELDKTAANLYVPATVKLTATVAPANATNKKVSWASDNTSVATVDANGLVTAVANGTATITVTTEDGEKTATCAIVVAEPQMTGTLYKKVTADRKDWTGKYLIVYEGESVALDGTLGSKVDAANNTISVVIDNYYEVIEGNELIDAAAASVKPVEDEEGAYSIGIKDGYIGITSFSNGLKFNAKAETYNNYFAYNSAEGCMGIGTPMKDGTMYLNFNPNKSDKRFRYYKDASQKPIQIYRLLVESDLPEIASLMTEIEKAKKVLNRAESFVGVNVFMYSQGACEKFRKTIANIEKFAKYLETEEEIYDAIDQLRKAQRELKPIFRGGNADYAIKHKESGLYLHIDEDGVTLAEEPTPINFHNLVYEPELYIAQYEGLGFQVVHSGYLYNTPERKYLGVKWEEIEDPQNSELKLHELVLQPKMLYQWFIAVTNKNSYIIYTPIEVETPDGKATFMAPLLGMPEYDEKKEKIISYNPSVVGFYDYIDVVADQWFIEDYAAPTFDVPEEMEGEYAADDATAISSASSAAVAVAYYSANGTQLKAAQKGLNIAKMSDGSIKKIMIK